MRSTAAYVSVSGPADPMTVWQRYYEPRSWSTWSPQIRSVEYEHSILRPDTQGVVRTYGGVGVAFTIEEVSTFDHTWTWRVVALGLRLRMVHGVRPTGGSGTQVWLTVSGPALIARAYACVATFALRRLVRR